MTGKAQASSSIHIILQLEHDKNQCVINLASMIAQSIGSSKLCKKDGQEINFVDSLVDSEETDNWFKLRNGK